MQRVGDSFRRHPNYSAKRSEQLCSFKVTGVGFLARPCDRIRDMPHTTEFYNDDGNYLRIEEYGAAGILVRLHLMRFENGQLVSEKCYSCSLVSDGRGEPMK